jgi:hypothetical protein
MSRLAAGFLTLLCVVSPRLTAQEVVGHTTEQSGDNHVLTFDLANGEQLVLELRDGAVFLNGTSIATTGAAAEANIELAELLRSAAALSTSEVVEAMAARELELAELRAALAELEMADAMAPSAGATADAEVATGANIVIREARRAPDRQTLTVATPHASGIARGSTSFVGGLAIGVTNLIAVFIALSFMGLGFLFFAPKQLETVADTVWHSFWRSFLAGLFAQPLLLPAFGMMVVGLTLTVVGILVVPFAIVGFAVALFLAAVGGFIAVARSVGEIYLRRKMARGEPVETWGSYRYIIYGLVGLLALWLPVVLLGWIPVAGTMLTISAALITWIIATAGFGATIISRAGVRGTFVRQLDLALTDEQYWTADAMPSPPRHGRVTRR